MRGGLETSIPLRLVVVECDDAGLRGPLTLRDSQRAAAHMPAYTGFVDPEVAQRVV